MTELVQISDLIRSGQPLPPLVLGYGEESYYINRLELHSSGGAHDPAGRLLRLRDDSSRGAATGADFLHVCAEASHRLA